MGVLTETQLEHFEDQGYLVVDGVLDPEEVLDPVIDEYAAVLDTLADELYEKGDISSRYEELPFGPRVTKISAESGSGIGGFDFSLPFKDVTEETPFWAGPAVFNALTHETLLDVVESLIGPEIYSNPVQHVRIMPPEKYLPRNEKGQSIVGATPWHQDHGVVTEDADETNMLTVWFPLLDAPVEKGPLKLVPGSHKGDLLTHCTNPRGVPEKLFADRDAVVLPLQRGSALFFHKRMIHCSIPNVSEEIRWSFDLRYNPIGQPTGRGLFPGFVARSRSRPETELRDPVRWNQLWLEARTEMATRNDNGEDDPSALTRHWPEGHPDCA